ncbi:MULTISPECIES: DUF3180 domain-containing protein [Microbacterium]|jgi:hypothetical protein|uniref:DUF3180 domain-containing protein n=1 Tax=Microbacterium aquilitoris TaxID=3067307 RepID=A0ABU3GJF1_9MICO|nr:MULTISPECIES: DUF3180 domain-containing protein [unclassified Microbacterium]MDT3329669.1 DUF3180 domain-containing protein [Microbacterium sp. KSW-18]MDT3345504.1 DUF3180 domain-containing protein [Microbacterium sp. KSW2-22]SDH22010.1 Protein of unknown function [Microbacterium sp. 77mftsu3.1]
MRRTNPLLLVAVAVVAGIAGFFVDQVLTGMGQPTFTPSPLLPILLVALGAAVVLAAIPVRRATAGTAAPVDPFRALRIAMLAKASSIVGALVAGFGGGLLAFVLTRPVSPSLGSTGAVIAAVGGGLLLVAGALVAEHLCTIRKDDDDDQPGPDEPGYGLSHSD